jgi:dienelactone hydrolase
MRTSIYLMFCILAILIIPGGCSGNRADFSSLETQESYTVTEENRKEFSESGTDNATAFITTTYSYQTQDLYAKRDEKQIYGVVYIPQNAGEKMPTVIFSHGFGGNYRVGAQYAEALARTGYVVYCFDFCGGSLNSKSDGSTLEMSIFTEQADLEAVIDMIQKQPFTDRRNIFLMGTSLGGAVSAVTAAANEKEIQGAILLYPAFVVVDDVNRQFKHASDIPDTYYHMWMTVGRAFAEDLLNYDIYRAISSYKKDVLLIHGDADSIVPLSYSEKAVWVYDSAILKVIPDAGHGFSGKNAEQAISWILEYLNTHTDSD